MQEDTENALKGVLEALRVGGTYKSKYGNKTFSSVAKNAAIDNLKIEAQQNTLIRSLTISLFLAFIAWNGGNIQIPGTGASIAELPAFLELSLILFA